MNRLFERFNINTRQALLHDVDGYVSKKRKKKAPSAAPAATPDVVHRFDLGINTDGFAPLIDDLVERTDISTLVAEELAVYPEDRHQGLCAHLGARFGVLPDCVVPTAGLVSAIDMTARVFLAEGDRYLLPVPNFFVFENYSTRTGAQPVYVRLDRRPDLQWDLAFRDRMIRALREHSLKLVWISNPANPTGQLIPAGYIDDIVSEADRLGAAVVVDEAFGEYTDGEDGPMSAVRLAEEHNNLLVFRSFSKMYGLPGARLGYVMCASPEVADALRLYRQYFSSTWLAKMLTRIVGVDDRDLESVRRIVNGRRRRFLANVERIPGCEALPSSTNTVMFRSALLPGGALWAGLAGRGVLTADLNGVTGIRGRGWIRATVRDDETNAHLLRALAGLHAGVFIPPSGTLDLRTGEPGLHARAAG